MRRLADCAVEEHFEKGRPQGQGLAMVVEELGLRRELYFYPGSRIDGLLKRVHVAGEKIYEFYGHTASRLWYRSVTLVQGSEGAIESGSLLDGASGKDRSLTASMVPVRSVLTVDVEQGREAAIRKMTEKYRRDPALPVHLDIAKVVYLLEEKLVQVTLQHAPGRITVTSRVYQKPSGHMEPLTVDPYAPLPRVSALFLAR